MILGDEINEEKWNEIRDSGILPTYLADIEIESELGRKTRGSVPDDSHLVETPIPNLSDKEEKLVDEGEGEDLEVLLSDDVLEKLNVLHSREELNNPEIGLKDIPKLYNQVADMDPTLAVRQDVEDNQVLDELGEDGELVGDEENSVVLDPAGINVENILPTRTRRNVRFNLPQLN